MAPPSLPGEVRFPIGNSPNTSPDAQVLVMHLAAHRKFFDLDTINQSPQVLTFSVGQKQALEIFNDLLNFEET